MAELDLVGVPEIAELLGVTRQRVDAIVRTHDNFPKPIGRNARAEEQAYPLVFLNSDAASYISGHNLLIDGGFLAAIMTGQIDPSSIMPS